MHRHQSRSAIRLRIARRRARAFTALVLAGATACHTWQQRPITSDAPITVVSRDRPVRVRRADQSTLELVHPQIVGDSLVGEAGNPPVRTAVALRDVTQLEERRVSAARTTGLVTGVALVPVVAAAATLALTLIFVKAVFH